MTSEPTLHTERLELAPVCNADADALLALFRLEPVRRYLLDGELVDAGWVASHVRDSQRDFREHRLGLWSSRRPGDPTLVGVIGFHRFSEPAGEELLYALHPDAWGTGLATEMTRAAIDHAFDATDCDRVRASADLPNQASLRVMQRLGMVETHREPVPEGSLWDQVHCSIDRDTWQNQRAAAAG